MAHVHVVVIGLSSNPPVERRLFEYAGRTESTELLVGRINAYLTDGPMVYVQKVGSPLSPRPLISKGSEATDFGHLTVTPVERSRLLGDEDFNVDWLRPYVGGDEYINGDGRWCLWLKDARPAEMRASTPVMKRLQAVAEARRASDKPRTRALAEFPALFGEDRQPSGDYLIIPKVSSQRREYIPVGIISANIIVSGSAQFIEESKLLALGVVTSRMHMAWMRAIGGRTKSDYQYSNRLVYNTFPWPEFTDGQRLKIEKLAQAILDARALPKNTTSTLADLYDPDTMPAELRRAHHELDGAVDGLYRRAPFGSDRERVEHLFTLYQRLVDPLQSDGVRQNRRVARKARSVSRDAD